MTQVSSQSELQSALAAGESQIEVIGNFSITSQVNITSTVTIRSTSGSTFTIKKASSYFAIMFRIGTNGNLTLENIILDGDKQNHPMDNTSNRTLISVNGGSLNLGEGSVLQNNNSYIEGGGIYVSGNENYVNRLQMTGNATIQNCTSRTSGGGVMVALRNEQDGITITDQVIIDGNQALNGGGIYLKSYVEGVAGLYSINGNVQIVNNRATSNGGGIFIQNFVGNDRYMTLSISENVVISDNAAGNHGGGIYFGSGAISDALNMIGDILLQRNVATTNGGGFYCAAPLIALGMITISDNVAGTGGGGYLLLTEGGVLEMKNCQILNNEAAKGESGSGGGLWINSRSTTKPFYCIITGSSFQNNVASAQGGGLFCIPTIDDTLFQLSDCQFNGNSAGTNGAGILLASAGTGAITLLNSTFHQNSAGNYGGGVYLTNNVSGNTTVTIENLTVTDNTAGAQGAGLRLGSGSGTLTTSINDSTISGNTADTNSGGGIWCGGNDVNLTITGTTLIDNNESNAGNGGGIYYNSAYGTMILQDEVKITSNRANQNLSGFGNRGGGICIISGNVTLQGNTEIANNASLIYGGGISTGEDAKLTMLSGTIHDNTSTLGGGVYNKNSIFYFKGGSIYQNRAQIGGGIYNRN